MSSVPFSVGVCPKCLKTNGWFQRLPTRAWGWGTTSSGNSARDRAELAQNPPRGRDRHTPAQGNSNPATPLQELQAPSMEILTNQKTVEQHQTASYTSTPSFEYISISSV